MSLSASKLKKLLTSPSKIALDILGYKYTDCNFKLAKGRGVESFLESKRRGKNPQIGLYYNREAFRTLKPVIQNSGMDLNVIQDDFEVEWSLAHLVSDLLSTSDLSEQEQEELAIEYMDNFSECFKLQELEINLPENASYQSYKSGNIYGLGMEFVSYIDWLGSEEGIDLKVTSKAGNPSLGDKMQIRIYEQLTGKPFKLVYVTPPNDKSISDYKKDYNILSLIREGMDVKEVVKELSTTKQYVEKVISRELVTPKPSIIEYSLTEEDKQFLDKLIPALAKKYVKILTTSADELRDMLLVDFEDFHFSESEKIFIKAHIMGEED